jgi:nucleoside-diphosphate-sugar epimerase
VRVLVTGGTGYLGGAIVRALHRHGHQPVIFARHASAAANLPGTRIEGDIRDRSAVRDAARGADAIVHTAAVVSVWQRDRTEFDRVNVGGLETVIDVCAALAIRRLIYTSSFLALPPSGRKRPLEANDYQRSKVRAREVARAAASRGIPIATLIPGVIYGPGADTEGNFVARLVRDHLAGRLPGIVGADHIWSFAFIDDVAEAHVSALEMAADGEEFVVGGENLPQMRLFEMMRDLAHHPVPRRIPKPAALALGWMEEVVARGRRPPRLTRGTVKILNHDWPLNSARSVEKLSYRITPLLAGVQAMLAVKM